jgi:chromate reductase
VAVTSDNDLTRVLGICGSLRKGSYNRMLLRAAQDAAPEGMSITIYPTIGDIPLYDEDLRLAGEPEPVTRFKAAVRQADALLIATPEYNYSIPGVLKNAIDWASRPPADSPLARKPTAILGAAGAMSGTMRAQLALRQVFVFTDTPSVLKPEVYVTFAPDKFDADGHLTDETARKLIAGLLESLRDLVGRVGR